MRAAAHGWPGGPPSSTPAPSSSWPPGSPSWGAAAAGPTLPIREVVLGVPVEARSPTWPRRSTTCTAAHQDRPAGRSARGPGPGGPTSREGSRWTSPTSRSSASTGGTLIDWEAGIAAVLGPWAREAGLDLADERLLAAYADHEAAVERDHPTARYPDVLATAFRRTGEALGRPSTTPGRGAWGTRCPTGRPSPTRPAPWPRWPPTTG